MRYLFSLLVVTLLFSCAREKRVPRDFKEVVIDEIFDDTTSIRAIVLMEGNLAFAGSNSVYGMYDPVAGSLRSSKQKYDTLDLQFRAVGNTKSDFFMLNVGNPALLYKTGDDGRMHVVYQEEHEKVFYDSMKFWNDLEGIAMGDPTENCLSVIITRDGGRTWNKVSCDLLPATADGEAAFAASNTNIAISENHTWLMSGGVKSRVFYSPDKGNTWTVFDTPAVQGTNTEGMYSLDFYNEKIGVAVGGDYSKPELNVANKILTLDGGQTWKTIADGALPGYASCVQFVPLSEGMEMVTVGHDGIAYSKDQGGHWEILSPEKFHTIRFLNDTVAYAAGNNRIAKITFKE